MDDSIVVKPQTLSKGRLWTALVAILLGQFVVAIDLTVLNIALPELTRDLSPSSDQLLWIVDVYSLVLAGFLVATSSLSDRFGRKKMLLAGFLIFGIGSVLVVFINDASQLIAIRAFLGIGGAMIMPITISMIRSIFTDSKERAIAVAAWSAISAIGMAAGPLIGGFLLELIEPPAGTLVPSGEGSIPHFAVYVDDLDKTAADLKAAGVISFTAPEKKVLPNTFGGLQNWFFTGPSGEQIELLQML